MTDPGFAVGDQMIVAYSPRQGFINISPSQQMGGSPETFFGNDPEKKATSQFNLSRVNSPQLAA